MTASCLKKGDDNHSLFEADKAEMEIYMKDIEMFMNV